MNFVLLALMGFGMEPENKEDEEDDEQELEQRLKLIPVVRQRKKVIEMEQEQANWNAALDKCKRLRSEYLEYRIDQISVLFQEYLSRLFEDPIRSKVVLFHEKSGMPKISFHFHYKEDEIVYENLEGFSGGEQDRILSRFYLHFMSLLLRIPHYPSY